MRFSTVSVHAVVAASLLRLLSITSGQTVIVVDASVLAVALGDDGTDGERARERLAGETLVAPELVDLEVVSVWRRQVAAKLMPARRAATALADLADLPLRRSSHQPFLHRIWEVRHVVTPYDAAYIALAEALDAVLVTADARLSRASGIQCEVEVIGATGGG
jgi:predicted nucleic acid-binding protein